MKFSFKNLTLATILMGTSCYASSSSSYYPDEGSSSSSLSAHTHPESMGAENNPSSVTLVNQDGVLCLKKIGTEEILEWAPEKFTKAPQSQSINQALETTHRFFEGNFASFFNGFSVIKDNIQFINNLIDQDSHLPIPELEMLRVISTHLVNVPPLNDFKIKIENFYSKKESENIEAARLMFEAAKARQNEIERLEIQAQQPAATELHAELQRHIEHLQTQAAISRYQGNEPLAIEYENEIKYLIINN